MLAFVLGPLALYAAVGGSAAAHARSVVNDASASGSSMSCEDGLVGSEVEPHASGEEDAVTRLTDAVMARRRARLTAE